MTWPPTSLTDGVSGGSFTASEDHPWLRIKRVLYLGEARSSGHIWVGTG